MNNKSTKKRKNSNTSKDVVRSSSIQNENTPQSPNSNQNKTTTTGSGDTSGFDNLGFLVEEIEAEEEVDRAVQRSIIYTKSSSDSCNDEVVNIDKYISNNENDETTQYLPRSFNTQELPPETKKKLEKEREELNKKDLSGVDEKIVQLCYVKMGLPKTSPLPGTIKSIFELDNTSDDMVLVSQLVFVHSLYEEEYNDESKYQDRANHLRMLLGEVTTALLGPDFAGDVHYGTVIDYLDHFLGIMRYPTRDDKDTNGNYCCWNKDNGCVIAKELLVPLFLSAEYAKQNGTYEGGKEYFTRVKSGGLDMYCTNLTKGTNEELETESDEIAEHVGLTPSQFKSLSFGIACMHIVNKVKHNDGKPAIVDMGSSYVMLEWCGCRGSFSGTYAHWFDTCHGQVWLTGCQLFYNEDTRDALADQVVRLWALILGLPIWKSQIANEFGLKGRSKKQIELLRQLRKTYCARATAVRLKNIEMLDRAGAELVNVFTTESTQTTALSSALDNVANAIRFGTTGKKRTKKTQGRELGRLVNKFNLHLLGNVLDQLSRTLEVSPLLSTRVKIDIINAGGSKTSAFIKSLSDNIFGINTGLNGSSSAEDVKVVLEKLNLSPDSNNEASVAFEKLKVHRPTVLLQLPALSTRLLNIERSRAKKAEKLAEKEAEKARKKRAREETFDEDVKQIKINRYNKAMEMKKKIEALKASKLAAKAKT